MARRMDRYGGQTISMPQAGCYTQCRVENAQKLPKNAKICGISTQER